jgi:hypothetical protein
MKNQILFLSLSFHLIFVNLSHSQNNIGENSLAETSLLFQDQLPLSIQLKYSIKNIKQNTNDSTYIESTMYYKNESISWDSIKIKLRARGGYRRENCYFVPLKLKLKKSITKGTLFEGNKKLKIVLPCLLERYNDDYVVKEYMAYKLYEVISPYHFNTRLANIELLEEKGKRIKEHELKGILIEDIDKVAKRFNGKEIDRIIHPMNMDTITAIQISFFQYLIGNTDFSLKYQHKEKLLFVDNEYISVPYDFDMSGLVNSSYAVVSNIQNVPLSITEVTQRLYKGYKRDEILLQEVRQYYLAHKTQIFDAVDDLKKFFHDPTQFYEAKKFIVDFYEVLESDKKFEKEFIKHARNK